MIDASMVSVSIQCREHRFYSGNPLSWSIEHSVCWFQSTADADRRARLYKNSGQ